MQLTAPWSFYGAEPIGTNPSEPGEIVLSLRRFSTLSTKCAEKTRQPDYPVPYLLGFRARFFRGFFSFSGLADWLGAAVFPVPSMTSIR
jgi:hypothetical protein